MRRACGSGAASAQRPIRHHFYVESTGKPIGVNLIGNWPALDVSKQKSTFLEREADLFALEIRRRAQD